MPCLTRHETARRLGIPRGTLRQWEKDGRIRATVCEAGWHWFDPEEVAALQERVRPQSARAFDLFAQGKSTVDVIIALKCEHHVVRGWKEAFERYQMADSQQLVIKLPLGIEHWAKAFNCSVEDLRSPLKLLCALEICMAVPELRRSLEQAVEQASKPVEPSMSVGKQEAE